jgi:GGDEF domain-containing protein
MFTADTFLQFKTLSTLIDRHNIGLVWIGADLRILHLTGNVATIMGIDPPPAGALVTAVFDELWDMDHILLEVIAQKRPNFTLELIEKGSGTERPRYVSVTFYPFEQAPEKTGLLMICENFRMGDLLRDLSQHYAVLSLSNQETKDAAWIDPLTMLGNRQALEHEIDRLALESKKSANELMIVLVGIGDPEGFEEQGDKAQRDQLIRSYARLLQAHCAPLGTVYRMSETVLIVIIPKLSAVDLGDLKHRLALVEEQIRARGFSETSASYSFTTISETGYDPREALQLAVLRMFTAKRTQRERKRDS